MAMQSDQEFAPTQIARAVFPTAFRGYDQDAVRRYLSRLAAALEHQQEYAGLGELEARTPAHERVEELESEVENLRDEIKDLELELVQRSVDGDPPSKADAETASQKVEQEDVAFDEPRAIELLGKETVRVLESARSAAADILKRAKTQAATLKAEAKAELEEAKRTADELVATKQSESDELVARLAADAETTAGRITTEAEEHRVAVLEESSKILTEAEELAEAEQADAEGRAKQIVADAETLRQQVISELVAERRLSQAEMDRMTLARDRLAMSLAVARSELDEVADALVDVSKVSFDAPVEPVAHTAESHQAEVDELIGTLDPSPTAKDDAAGNATPESKNSSGPKDTTTPTDAATPKEAQKNSQGHNRKKRGKRRKNNSTGNQNNPGDQNSTGNQNATEAKNPKVTPINASFDTGGESFAELRSDAAPATATTTETSTGDDAVVDQQVVTGSALLMAEETAAAADGAAVQEDTAADATDTAEEVTAEEVTAEEVPAEEVTAEEVPAEEVTAEEVTAPEVDEVDPDEPIDLDKIIELGLGADGDGPDGSPISSDLNTPPADGEELSLVQGFTTIDLADGEDIDLRESGGDGSKDADADDDKELVHSVLVNEPQIPEEMITTVTSRTASGQQDRTRGDLLIDEKFTGRLPKEFGARDLALTRSGPNFRRQLRRALNDDQSDVLDRLRAGRGKIDVDELPPFDEQIDRYLAPLRRGLSEIAQAGATAGGHNDLTQTALDNLVRQLARYIVDKVRMPTVAALEATKDQDRERILEPIRTLYRDFRNVGLPDLTEDALYEAFAIGLYDSIEPSAPISWVIDPRCDPDPVCEINRQRDDVVKGVVFPSGHARPLSLPGCRCLVKLAEY